MKSKVYFIPVKDTDKPPAIADKIEKLLDESRVLECIRKNDKVAVKMHFGEEGNTGFVRPEFAAIICRRIAAGSKAAFVSDTNTLYRGKRTNSKDHLQLAREHGFTKKAMGMDVIIPDDAKKEDTAALSINQKFIKTAKVARIFIEAHVFIAINHFKGHILTGFGGAIKNIGMGCAMREGKLAQHCEASPVVHTEKCIGCDACEKICPVHAIHLENKKSVIDTTVCIGCASCLAVCPTMAMFIDFGAGFAVQEKMAEYAMAVLKGKRAGFINFAVRINKECDCWGMDNPRIAPDVGILASADPVSIDKASFDVIHRACGKDIFEESHPGQDGMRQLKSAQRLGLGSLDYELIEL